MKSRHNEKCVQLTIRSVPAQVKKLLSDRAGLERKSLNTVLVEVLTSAAGIGFRNVEHTDLDDLAGRWVDDPDFDSAISAQHEIDRPLWE